MKMIAFVSSIIAVLLSAMPACAAPPDVTAESGIWLVAKKHPVFVHVGDGEPGKSECMERCLLVWSPLIAAPDARAGAGWTIATQEDGRRIWAYEGKPVYTLIDPERNGYPSESALWLWARATPWNPPGVTVGEHGLMAKDDGGKLRHVRRSECDEECKTYWQPMAAPDDAVAVQDWAVVHTDNGGNVWATEPDKRIVYEQRPGTTPPPPLSNTKNSLGFSSMVGINPFRPVQATTPVAIRPGARDLHDIDVTLRPKLADGVTPPVYPSAALRAGQQGRVSIQYCVGMDGKPTSHVLAVSSAFPLLNDATNAWAPTVKFIAGEVNGAPAETCGYVLNFDWRLPR